MNRRRALGILTAALSFTFGGWSPQAVAAASGDCDCERLFRFDRDGYRRCKRSMRASSGRAEAGRDCYGKTYARADRDLEPIGIKRRIDRDHPIERVRARGNGKIKATGDKGAKREFRNKRRWVK